MRRNYFYALVLVLTLAAWFSPFTPAPKHHVAQKEQAVKQDHKAILDPISAGISSGKMVVGGNCNIETINGKLFGTEAYVMNRDTPLLLTGWGVDKDHARLPKSVVIQMKSSEVPDIFLPVKFGLERIDVQEYLSLSESLLASGFELSTGLQSIPNGEYAMALIMIFEDTLLICDNGRKIRIQ